MDIVKRCTDNGIPVFEERWKVKQGWLGKPKGMLQVLWERGFIDPDISVEQRWNKYPEKGLKDNLGQVIPGTALKEIIANLKDFAEEKTLLQTKAESRSTADCQIMLIRSPKCHPELAGEGIEYDWAGVKNHYRCSAPKKKKDAKGFRELVNKSLESIDFGQRISFSAKARQYMLAYDVMAAWEDKTLSERLRDGQEKLPETSAQLLDDTVKV